MPTRFLKHTAGLLTLLTAALVPDLLRAGAIDSFITADGYTFTNFDGPDAGNAAGAGTNINAIANNGDTVGFSINNNGTLTNFVRNPDGTFTTLELGFDNAMALGINSAGTVVGQQNGQAFVLPNGGSPQALSTGPGATAFGINDQGDIVGQQSAGGVNPGFLLPANGSGLVTIVAPSGPDIVNAQAINNGELVVGFYIGNDGQFHGFEANAAAAMNGVLFGNAIADPTIPNVPGEPGATFVFSQILGVNDEGIAVGYYGDSTASQHGFLYNLNTGTYSFLDDPAEAFDNGVEVTQITGINDLGEITGFYSDANGVSHGFVACPTGSTCTASGTSATPEPASLLMAGLGLSAFVFRRLRVAMRSS